MPKCCKNNNQNSKDYGKSENLTPHTQNPLTKICIGLCQGLKLQNYTPLVTLHTILFVLRFCTRPSTVLFTGPATYVTNLASCRCLCLHFLLLLHKTQKIFQIMMAYNNDIGLDPVGDPTCLRKLKVGETQPECSTALC